jgi:uncharacterized membrane protein
MDQFISNITDKLILVIELISIILILFGVITTTYCLVVKTAISRNWDYYAQSRLILSRFLLLALEFQIAADILETVLKPGWEEFGQLAATIIIRSVLSYVLILETKSQT